MSERRLNFNAPIMSVRRIAPMNFEAAAAKVGADNKSSVVECAPCDGALGRPAAAVPFLWEQTPGRPKTKLEEDIPQSHSRTYALPPGRAIGAQFSGPLTAPPSVRQPLVQFSGPLVAPSSSGGKSLVHFSGPLPSSHTRSSRQDPEIVIHPRFQKNLSRATASCTGRTDPPDRSPAPVTLVSSAESSILEACTKSKSEGAREKQSRSTHQKAIVKVVPQEVLSNRGVRNNFSAELGSHSRPSSNTDHKNERPEEVRASVIPNALPASSPYITERRDAPGEWAGNDDNDTFSNANEVFSTTDTQQESNVRQCQVSVLGPDERQQEPISYTDPHARDFIMDRFLPAAKAMTSELSEPLERRVAQDLDSPCSSPRSARVSRSLVPGRSRFANFMISRQEFQQEEDEEDEEEHVHAPNFLLKGCGLLPFQMPTGFKGFKPNLRNFKLKRINRSAPCLSIYGNASNDNWPTVYYEEDSDEAWTFEDSNGSNRKDGCFQRFEGNTVVMGHASERKRDDLNANVMMLLKSEDHPKSTHSLTPHSPCHGDDLQAERINRGKKFSGFLGVPKDGINSEGACRDISSGNTFSSERSNPYDVGHSSSSSTDLMVRGMPSRTSELDGMYSPSSSSDNATKTGLDMPSHGAGYFVRKSDEVTRQDVSGDNAGPRHVSHLTETPHCSLEEEVRRTLGDQDGHGVGENSANLLLISEGSCADSECRRRDDQYYSSTAEARNLSDALRVQGTLCDDVEDSMASAYVGWPFGTHFARTPSADSKDTSVCSYPDSPSNSSTIAHRQSPGKTSPVSVLQPPLPKSPSESWLWRVLPSLPTTRSQIGSKQVVSTKKSLEHSLNDVSDVKWETSENQGPRSRFAEDSTVPAKSPDDIP